MESWKSKWYIQNVYFKDSPKTFLLTYWPPRDLTKTRLQATHTYRSLKNVFVVVIVIVIVDVLVIVLYEAFIFFKICKMLQ